MIINLIQDIPTPHNNNLISAFKGEENIELRVWYAEGKNKALYNWKEGLADVHIKASVYGRKFNWNFIKYCIKNNNEIFIIVGWMNLNTKLLHLLFFLLRRPFNHWTDLPNPNGLKFKKIILRQLGYMMLKKSRANIFVVGGRTKDYFLKLNFPTNRLINLPIFVDLQEISIQGLEGVSRLFSRLGINKKNYLVVGGSRLIPEKGYDLLIRAISLLDVELKQKIKVVIVGCGIDSVTLKNLIVKLNLSDQIIIEDWMEIEDFKALISKSDVFVHPARFDSYGGTILAMALGVPVIGAYTAGAAFDRINHGHNGFIYDAEDIQALASYITIIYKNPELKKCMAHAAYKTAAEWPPSRGVDIIKKNAI